MVGGEEFGEVGHGDEVALGHEGDDEEVEVVVVDLGGHGRRQSDELMVMGSGVGLKGWVE